MGIITPSEKNEPYVPAHRMFVRDSLREAIMRCTYCNKRSKREICRLCASHGRPITETEVRKKYPQIKRIQIVQSSRGHVTSISRVWADCADCGGECSIEYKTFLEHPKEVRCVSCARRHGRKMSLVFPRQVKGVISCDVDTLGEIGQLVEHTRVSFLCVTCANLAETRYGSYRKGVRHCKLCVPLIPKSIAARRKMSRLAKARWKDPKYRELTLRKQREGQQDHSGIMSGPHKRLKKLLIDGGLKSFQSEQWITDRIRVDEVDPSRKIVVEMFGDYYHANPKLYKAGTLIRLGPGKNWRASDIWRRDKERIRTLKKLGYSVIVVWEGKLMKLGVKALSKVFCLFPAPTTASAG